MTNSVNQGQVRRMTGESGSPRPRLIALFPQFDRSPHASDMEHPAHRLALVIVLPWLLATIVTSAQICRSQDAAAPPATGKDQAGQNHAPKRADSPTQPSGQRRMFGIMPAYGLVE